MVINIQDDILRLNAMGLLTRLLQDKATKGNILWATNAYSKLGKGYEPGNEIRPERITGENSDLIKTRARRAMEQRTERTRQHAEVFTPRWVVSKMNDFCDQQWFDREDGIHKTDEQGRIQFNAKPTWKQYVDARRMEITAGEAPFLCSRYDVETGEHIPVEERIGLLDRKLRVVSEQAQDMDEWQLWALRAVQSVYGYELQGDNLLIARVNILCTVEEHLYARWREKPEKGWLEKLCNVIAWNLWQMDGLSGCVPVPPLSTEEQLSLFPPMQEQTNLFGEAEQERIPCRLFDWRGAHSISYKTLREEGKKVMKFDFIIGNPPYQEETESDSTRKPPIYNNFMDETYEIADVVELITPARFLFNAGQTPKAWNQKMLDDTHFRVLYYEQDASKIFANTDIKGGVAITYRDANKLYSPIRAFVPYKELRVILEKAGAKRIEDSLTDIADSSNVYDLKNIYADHPNYRKYIGDGGRHSQLKTNVLNINPIFTDKPTEDDDFSIYGLVQGKRGKKYCHRRYIKSDHKSLFKYKVLVPKAAGSGKFGDAFPEMLVVEPESAFTQTYISIGTFDNKKDAMNLSKYLKTKLCRALLYVLKVTQDNLPAVWRFIPKQNFSNASDIDWSKSIPEIDRQLYAKYGLDEDEIAFIESHVKEMS